ncbi:MAG: DcaP family trimeric outer membrane transporter [Halieaceae bacterium]|nr:DcaP family trimeric outer membrane transporter [Halieaceae bacterium]
MSQVIALLQQQQKELAEQRKLLEAQALQISNLENELVVLRAPAAPVSAVAVVASGEPPVVTADTPTAEPRPAIPADTEQQLVAVEVQDQPPSTQQQQADLGKSVAKAQVDDPTRVLLSDFVGGWRLPGTDAALRIGGFVKTAVVYNFDPLEIADRFIVGSIPVGQNNASTAEAESSITASQSRLNFDLREPTDVGILRAFIEGDFAGDGDTFRLRHAFGQWNRVLAGKTWSAFMDTDASPEEVDFEGLNGRINVRQAQVRLMPKRGAEYGLELSLEDPNPEIQNGGGVTRAPDVVVSGRFNPNDRLHMKLSVLGRQIRGQADPGFGAGVSKQYAWGVSASGRFVTPYFDERDSLVFQLSQGDGIGRYVNDLASVGNFDGIFDPVDGDLQLFDVLAGYTSWQHWWGGERNFRSNFTFGFVDVNNPGFVAADAYKRTYRFATNLLWSPTRRIDLGVEYLWGQRQNENGEEGDATQLQLMSRYRF